jgi:hemoglobin-like flavoprotein
VIYSDRWGAYSVAPPPSGPLERPDRQAMTVVQRTAAVVADRPVALAEAFYQHLFELAPGVRSMFPEEMSAQNEKLCRALFQCVRALVSDDREATEMERVLRRLGADHAERYAVLPEHYPYVGHALARAVRDLSQDWSTTCTSSWIWVYTWMSEHMLAPRS